MGKDQDVAGIVAEAMEAVAVTQAIGLGVLRAEMEALTRLLPGASGGAAVADETQAEAAARQAAETAAIEDGFDNMPV